MPQPKKSAEQPEPEMKEDGHAFADVTEEVEQVKQEMEAPQETDEDGNVVPRTSEATAKVAEEEAVRAGASFNGGGPWPPELLAKVGTTPGNAVRDIPEYTSHLSDDEGDDK